MSINPSQRRVPQTPGHHHPSERNHLMSASGIQSYRTRMLQRCPKFEEVNLTQFVQSIFAKPEVVAAYGFPLHLPVVVAVANQPVVQEALPESQFEGRQVVTVIPFRSALQAAHLAQNMKILDNESDLLKRLTALAALLSPCGLFMINHPTAGPGGLMDETVAQAAHQYQRKALGHALAVLSDRAPDVGKLLSFTLGFPFQGGVPSQQASKVATAVILATLRVRHLWGTAGLSLPRAPF
jgi:hypothetical protein